ncbi:hypothetical protein SAMD00019534_009940 [Acytostelium subglobosum LB1]|uniref:hypothetical protein n=1 Tax=Acytostelium subglobosum LB1 TaxID=1410327 RepID=UPI000644D90E|nr:hypothetical protein SAMD00019534_009940 [Acytostelium subglobosum LB1]GAM17819.1 hypothetical protein SAMD00019534_009940 [Acytostelium subglobosum LB1]|eukprot:XP_012758415.1 hypothetical protein SAMD00019534_009940 [Acytostelium subglobosum LB1]
MSKILIIATLLMMAAVVALACDEPFFQPRPSEVLYPGDLSRTERKFHEKYMKIAYDLAVAKKNLFTTVIVHPNGTVMCTGLNQNPDSAILHGEMVAMLNCSKIHHQNVWDGYYLYTTGESCPMCHSAAMWMGFRKVVYGTSIKTLYCDKCLGQIPITSAKINANYYGIPKSPPPQIIGGILAHKTDTIYPNFCADNSNPWHVDPICTPCANDRTYESDSD